VAHAPAGPNQQLYAFVIYEHLRNHVVAPAGRP
jgi:hypothetical protein